MGAYNLTENDLVTVRESIDELLICMVNSDLLNRKLGVGKAMSVEDTSLLAYLYDFLHHRYCKNSNGDKCVLDKINSLYYKYK